MPIDKSWGEEEKVEYVAQITELREQTDMIETASGADEIRRIYVDLDDVNPDILTRFPIRFRASRHRSASWIKWLNALEYLGFKCKEDPNVLEGKWVHIREEPQTSEINGEQVDWIFPRPVGILQTEEAAFEVFETLPKVATVALTPDLETEAKLVTLYESVNGDRKNFGIVAGDAVPEGMSMDDAFAFAKSRVESKDVPF